MEVGAYLGRCIDIECDLPEGAAGAFACRDAQPENRYPWRPRIHFTPEIGWLNDPNGLVYADGVYHLYHQWNPYGTEWGNMHWGHAVSRDLTHWEDRGMVMAPDVLGMVYSGSAWHDTANVAGFGRGALLFFYTAAGGSDEWSADAGNRYAQCLAVSLDGGATLAKKGVILEHVKGSNRDPKVFYHAPSGAYIMALFLDAYEFALYRSQDLLHWRESQRFSADRMRECPDLFELPVDGGGEKKWVFWSADGFYRVGDFDGHRFTPETDVLEAYDTALPYAAQSYAGIDGRTVSVAWLRTRCDRGDFRGMTSVPAELSLTRRAEGVRLRFKPAREVLACFAPRAEYAGDAANAPIPLSGAPTLLELEWAPGCEKRLRVGQTALTINADGDRATVLVDCGILEYYADGGRVYGAVEAEPEVLDGTLRAEGTLRRLRIQTAKAGG